MALSWIVFSCRAACKVSWAMALLVLCVGLLAGCGANPGVPASGVKVTAALHGSVHGGQQPVSGSTIQLYAMGTQGNGSAASPLLHQTVLTDSRGNFDLTGGYTCPTPTSQVYLSARGGNPGNAGGTKNDAIALLVMLGPCGAITDATYVTINEVTTVGAVYPLASYMTSSSTIGYAANDTGFAEAITQVNELANSASGVSPGLQPAPGMAVQTTKLNSLADVLSTCVNSTGGVAGDSTPCGTFFSLLAPAQGPAPADTVRALVQLALSPATGVASIYNLVPPAAAFQPALTVVPSDWSLDLVAIPSPPTISPASGTYPSGEPIALSSLTAGAAIRYTLDGSSPTQNSALYAAPLLLSSGVTVHAISVKTSIASPTVAATYTPVAGHLAFAAAPPNVVVGDALSPAVLVLDGAGNVIQDAGVPVTLSMSGAALNGTTIVTSVDGVAQFLGLGVSAAGSGYVLFASSPLLAPASSAAFTASLPTLTLTLPAASVSAGSSITATVTLNRPAVSSVTVSLASSANSILSPAVSSLAIAPGSSAGSFVVNGITAGSSSLSAAAAGYTTANLAVAVVLPAPATTLRQAGLQHGLLMGAAGVADEFGYIDPLTAEPLYGATLGTQYGMVEPEAAMKWIVTQPSQTTYNFEPADQLVAFAQAHQMLVRGHNLCWNVANPDWLNALAATSSPAVLAQALHDHIFAMMAHYHGKVFAWDVVNEVLSDASTGVGTQMADSIWYNQPGIGLSGTGYVEQALRWAHEADPDALLFDNEYLIYTPGNKFESLYHMMADFKARGVPIDGVGMQLHIGINGWPDSVSLASNIQRLAGWACRCT